MLEAGKARLVSRAVVATMAVALVVGASWVLPAYWAATATALHLAHEEYPYTDQQQHREPGDEDLHQQRFLLGRLRLDLDTITQQVVDHLRIIGRVGGEGLATAHLPLDGTPVDNDVLHPAGFDIRNELGVRQALGTRRWGSEVVEHGHQDDRNDHPQKNVFRHVVQFSFLLPRRP